MKRAEGCISAGGLGVYTYISRCNVRICERKLSPTAEIASNREDKQNIDVSDVRDVHLGYSSNSSLCAVQQRILSDPGDPLAIDFFRAFEEVHWRWEDGKDGY
jgi:hypothetical protein